MSEPWTQAEVDQWVRAEARRQEEARLRERIAAYRRKYPTSTAQDYIVAALIEMADAVGREP